MQDREKLLQLQNLITEFSSDGAITKAVDDISFDLNHGETLGIVGESGSGKSVTSLSIMRLISGPSGKIASGKIIFNSNIAGNIDLVAATEKQMQQLRGNEIAMIFQEPMTSLNPVFTCGYQVMESLMLHKNLSKAEAKKQTISLFEKVKLPDPEIKFAAYPHQLSGGQKQRVMIAMAIACNPRLLIADEPTTALDVTVQATILELLRDLKKDFSMSMIFITHDLGVIAEVADKVAVMYKGKIVEAGTVNQIFTNPQHPYTKGLLDCRPPLDKKLKRLPVIADFLDQLKTENENIQVNYDYKTEITTAEINSRLHLLKTAQPILEVKNLCTWFPKTKKWFGKIVEYNKAVDDVSFHVYPGETLGLVGESGCGKTTLGRSILNLIKPTSGNIFYNQTQIESLSDQDMIPFRKQMQIIFQDPYSSLNPRMTIGNAILEPMTVHSILQNQKERKDRVEELMQKVNLDPSMFNRYPHEFSGGQRQRVCIARALAVNPQFIVCDESVSALDVSVQAQVLNLLLQLREEFNLTYIFISHDLSVVKFMSDRMVVMNNGKIEEMGNAEDVYHDPKSDYTKRLIASIPKGFIHKHAIA